MRYRRALLLASILLVPAAFGPTAAQETPEYGPAKGALVIAGGGSMDGTGIVERFIELAGGPDKALS
ncbi:MAG: hypothetical protein AB1806_02195 [Acidobacteriota bacterium]